MKSTRLAGVMVSLLAVTLFAPGAAAASTSSAGPVYWYQVIARHSGKCLDVANASLKHAANVIQGVCGGPAAYNQQWRIRYVEGGDGAARVIARHSGMCLDVAYARLEHGANVVQGVCGGAGSGANQLWRFKRVAVTWE